MKTKPKKSLHKKRHTNDLLPKFWQPKVGKPMQSDCKVHHWNFTTQLEKCTANDALFWGWIEACLTYSEMMRLLAKDGTEFTAEATEAMASLVGIQPGIIERLSAQEGAYLTSEEMEIAILGASVMDLLVEKDRYGIAWAARQYGNGKMEKLKAAAAANKSLGQAAAK